MNCATKCVCCFFLCVSWAVAKVKDDPVFIDTLDYIFISKNLKVNGGNVTDCLLLGHKVLFCVYVFPAVCSSQIEDLEGRWSTTGKKTDYSGQLRRFKHTLTTINQSINKYPPFVVFVHTQTIDEPSDHLRVAAKLVVVPRAAKPLRSKQSSSSSSAAGSSANTDADDINDNDVDDVDVDDKKRSVDDSKSQSTSQKSDSNA